MPGHVTRTVCGSLNGLAAHLNAGEEPCGFCAAASAFPGQPVTVRTPPARLAVSGPGRDGDAVRARERETRSAGLAAYRAEVDAYAAAALTDTRLAAALEEIAAAVRKAAELAEEHNAEVERLAAGALELGAGEPGVHGVQVRPGSVTAGRTVRRINITPAVHAAVVGDMRAALLHACPVTDTQGRPLDRHV